MNLPSFDDRRPPLHGVPAREPRSAPGSEASRQQQLDPPGPGTSATPAADEPLARAQLRLTLAFGGLLGLLFLGLAALTHAHGVFAALEKERTRFFLEKDVPFHFKRRFVDPGSSLFLEKVPFADFSSGVFLFGSSNMLNAFMDWEVPTYEGLPILNLAVGGASHTDQLALMRYLHEHKGFLREPDGRSLVLLGLFYTNAHHREVGILAEAFGKRSDQYGILRYDRTVGLEEVLSNPLARRTVLERNRIAHLLQTLRIDLAVGWDPLIRVAPPLPAAIPPHNPRMHREGWIEMMGPDWKPNMLIELEALDRTLRYLLERGAAVRGVLMPAPSWHRALPHFDAYQEEVPPLFARHEVPLVDLGLLLPDEKFRDHTHMSYSGSQVSHAELMKVLASWTPAGGS